MKGLKVMIVDDSPFSRTLLGEILGSIGCQVTGEVDSIDSMIEAYTSCKPDIVTIDLIMPGSDGFECSRALLLQDPNAKIVLISSVKDEETVAEARRLGISGYIQKPVDGETLLRIFKNVMSPDAMFLKLKETGAEVFGEALAQTMTRMTKVPANFSPSGTIGTQFLSQGITTVIGIIGRHSGTMIMDLSMETAERIVFLLLHRRPKNPEETIAMVAELGNIVAGTACSMLNNMDKAFGLRVSPPSLFSGNTSRVASPGVELQGGYAETECGHIFLGIGFKRGSVLWT